jgi:hypothetical protein
MSAAHPHKEGRLPNSDKPAPVMNDNRSKVKLDRSLPGNLLQLMFGHFPVRFVVDPLDLAPILGAANNPLKINSRAGSGIDSAIRHSELRVCQ